MVVNLFAYRTPYPSELTKVKAELQIGIDNDKHIAKAVSASRAVVVGWGAIGKHRSRIETVMKIVGAADCLGTTKDGHPRHPSRVKNGTHREVFMFDRSRMK